MKKLLVSIHQQRHFQCLNPCFYWILSFFLWVNLPTQAEGAPLQSVLDTEVTVTLRHSSLEGALKEIEKAIHVRFMYANNTLPEGVRLSLSFRNKPLKAVLDKLIIPYELSYLIEGEAIIIRSKNDKRTELPSVPRPVKGKVTNEVGEGMPGVSVSVKGTLTGTTTDINGVYNLSIEEKSILVFSFIGYLSEEVESGNQTTINVTLLPDVKSLKEIVVVGYGTQQKKEITGAIASIKGSDLKDQPVTTFEQAITGKVAGVQVMQNTGAPGGSLSVRIRGANSITAGNDPLYVIDGFPISDDLKDMQGATDDWIVAGRSFQKSPNPMATLNPDDIASVEVLKDASAAAIYGSRASNGVVLISTKKGSKTGATVMNYTTYAGVQQLTGKIDMLNAYEYAQLNVEGKNNTYLDRVPGASINDDNVKRSTPTYQIPPELQPYLNGTPGLTDTDWQDAIFQTAVMQSHTLSASGGSDKMQYYISGNYFNQPGILIHTNFRRLSARANLLFHLKSNLRVGLSLNPTYNTQNLVNSEGPYFNDGIINTALKASPIFPVYNPDGSYAVNKQNTWGYDVTPGENPVALANEIHDQLDQSRNLHNAYLEYDLVPGLTFKTYFGIDLNSFRRNYFRPSSVGLSAPVTPAPSNPIGISNTASATNWVSENTVTYRKEFGQKHKLEGLAGYIVQKNHSESNRVRATNFPNNQVQTVNAGQVTEGNSLAQEWSLLSYLGRVSYAYADKYFLTATLRRDGSSRFGKNSKWGVFPSISGGWSIRTEPFFQVSAISELKLRASYGLTGNFQIPNYGSLALMGTNNYVLGATTGNVVNGVAVSSIGNEELSWEKTQMFNAGLDLGLLDDRIFLTADYYRSTTSDLLLQVNVPLSTGFRNSLQNIGKVQNQGVELAITSHNLTKGLKWNSTVNFSANRNKVLALGPKGDPIISNGGVNGNFITQIGQPVGSYYGWVFDGVFKNQAELDAYPHYANSKPGDRRYVDINNDHVIDQKDRTTIGSYFPDFIWGFTNEFKWKGFDLSLALQGVQGSEIMNLQRRYIYNMEGNMNLMQGAMNRWVSADQPGDGQHIRANRAATGNNGNISTWHVEDGSYVRLRNISMGYTFPKAWFKDKISYLRVYVAGQNLWTSTKYTGYNPEVNARPGNALSQGEDYGTYPLSKTILLGLNCSF